MNKIILLLGICICCNYNAVYSIVDNGHNNNQRNTNNYVHNNNYQENAYNYVHNNNYQGNTNNYVHNNNYQENAYNHIDNHQHINFAGIHNTEIIHDDEDALLEPIFKPNAHPIPDNDNDWL